MRDKHGVQGKKSLPETLLESGCTCKLCVCICLFCRPPRSRPRRARSKLRASDRGASSAISGRRRSRRVVCYPRSPHSEWSHHSPWCSYASICSIGPNPACAAAAAAAVATAALEARRAIGRSSCRWQGGGGAGRCRRRCSRTSDESIGRKDPCAICASGRS